MGTEHLLHPLKFILTESMMLQLGNLANIFLLAIQMFNMCLLLGHYWFYYIPLVINQEDDYRLLIHYCHHHAKQSLWIFFLTNLNSGRNSNKKPYAVFDEKGCRICSLLNLN